MLRFILGPAIKSRDDGAKSRGTTLVILRENGESSFQKNVILRENGESSFQKNVILRENGESSSGASRKAIMLSQ